MGWLWIGTVAVAPLGELVLSDAQFEEVGSEGGLKLEVGTGCPISQMVFSTTSVVRDLLTN